MQVSAQSFADFQAAMSVYCRAETAEDYQAGGQLLKAVCLAAGCSRAVLNKTPAQVAAYVRNKIRHGIYCV